MSGLIKTGIGFFTGGTSVWLPYAIVAGVVAAGTGWGMWSLILSPRLEAAQLRVSKAEYELGLAVAANEETQRSLRVMQRQAEYDRQAAAAAIADAQAKTEAATKAKKDIANVKGAQDAVDPIELYTNRRLRELQALRHRKDGNAVSAAPGTAAPLQP